MNNHPKWAQVVGGLIVGAIIGLAFLGAYHLLQVTAC